MAQAASLSGPIALLDASAVRPRCTGSGSTSPAPCRSTDDHERVLDRRHDDRRCDDDVRHAPPHRSPTITARTSSSHATAEGDAAARSAVPATFATPGWAWGVYGLPAPQLGSGGPIGARLHDHGRAADRRRRSHGHVRRAVPRPRAVALVTDGPRPHDRARHRGTRDAINALTQTHVAAPRRLHDAGAESTAPSRSPTQPAIDGVGLVTDGLEALARPLAAARADLGRRVARRDRLLARAARTRGHRAEQPDPDRARTSPSARGGAARCTWSPDLLEAGATYYFEVSSVAELPHAADGDFRTVSYPAQPTAVSSMPSAMFSLED